MYDIYANLNNRPQTFIFGNGIIPPFW